MSRKFREIAAMNPRPAIYSAEEHKADPGWNWLTIACLASCFLGSILFWAFVVVMFLI